MEAPDFSDEALERLISDMREDARAEGEDVSDAEPVPVPEELKARIMAKAAGLSAMRAAAEARAEGVDIKGFEPSPGADEAHYGLTPAELREYLFGEQAA
jgi:hypothetical protein